MVTRTRGAGITRNVANMTPTARRTSGPAPTWTPPATRGVPGCTGKNEDDDPGGTKPKNDDEPTKPGCK